MPRSAPSTLQLIYVEQVAGFLSTDLLVRYRDGHNEVRTALTGNGPSNQIPQIPESMAREWASTAAENLRKRILAYFMESGLWPE